ncbi:MAG: hypothetical protein FJY11_08795 [Bacteroidetes bacterium]|nr:hypothetical protein [Bacteroidota bacterium]
MLFQENIWSDYPLSTRIATTVCYAGVFGDVISVEEMVSRFGQIDRNEFSSALEKLIITGRVIVRDGYAALPELDGKIDLKVTEVEITSMLLKSRIGYLRRFGRNPAIKFVGVSGSLAAGNPVRDRDNTIDLDVFVITRNQCIWLYGIPASFRRMFKRKSEEPSLCFNLVFDESDLAISNRNFYTATEIINVIPVSGLEMYRRFLRVNSWVDTYYPGFSGSSSPPVRSASYDIINKGLYFVYTLLRSMKNFSLKPLRNLTFRRDPLSGINYNRISHYYGGYQALVQRRFAAIAERWFPEMIDSSLIEKLFPDDLSIALRNGEIDIHKLMEERELQLDYGKYE